MNELNLTPTSYLILGLIAGLGPCTSYDMKRMVGASIGYFWSFPHSQLYAEPSRLAASGLLSEEQEAAGRRRRTFSLTLAGRDALSRWLAEPTDEPTEMRDLGVLKLFFGSQTGRVEVSALAEGKERAHRDRLREYESIRVTAGKLGADAFQLATLELGMRYERTVIDFWHEVASAELPGSSAQTRPAPTS